MRKGVFFGIVIAVALIATGSYIIVTQPPSDGGLMGFKELAFADPSVESVSSGGDVSPPLSETIPQTTQANAEMRGYQNAKFKFSLLYPQAMQVREYVERDGALSVTFDNETSGEGFQIYVTPYKEKQITEARFKLDQPSGVYKEPVDVVVDGTRATMFFGHNSIMGETREVWFIRGGYLYEVATYKQLDTWLGSIMQTWKFL